MSWWQRFVGTEDYWGLRVLVESVLEDVAVAVGVSLLVVDGIQILHEAYGHETLAGLYTVGAYHQPAAFLTEKKEKAIVPLSAQSSVYVTVAIRLPA
jgi:hypothetical protein